MAGVEAAVLRSPALLCVLMLLGLQRPVAGRALKFVNLIYRHGDRSPIQAYPADPYTEKDWPQGFAQLTQVGMKQHYALGQYLRHRYNTFLNSSYDRHEVYVQSTDIDRTLMSAQVNLAGLYIPQGHQIFHPDVKWQPIPVHTVPVEQDEFLKFPRKNCPRFQKLLEETMNSREVREKIQKNTDFLNMVSNNTKMNVTMLNEWKVYDTLFCEHDVTLIALQMALNVYNYIIPPYASCFMFELYEEDDRSFTLDMYFRNQSDSEPHLLTLPNCSEHCPLQDFIRITKHLIADDWEEECKISSDSNQTGLVLGAALSTCFVLLIVLGITLYWRWNWKTSRLQVPTSSDESA
ncbi:lysosomal acid phosphatase-like isoform X6 [Hypanus sabinus]|uniref:lysosomal acid phosphatase-like isoform X6 n=1 Tax=Hypanus sabinus TaxID=79690 RepID=UPI0028C3EEF6|nr:lysosomal acid phosphatase-like isoform X6 [Hypanus sabinus]